MSNHTIKIDVFDPDSIKEARQQTLIFKREIHRKTKVFIQRLAEIGLFVAETGYMVAPYAGTKDVSVRIQNGDKGMSRMIVATGQAVIFIEFGTGISYPDPTEEEAEAGVPAHGTYGHGFGANTNPPGWYYSGDVGEGGAGELVTEGKHKGQVFTEGNPASQSMYHAREAVLAQVPEIAKEVFG